MSLEHTWKYGFIDIVIVGAFHRVVPVRRGDFDGFWQFLMNFSRCRNTIFLKRIMFNRATHPPHPSCENLAGFASKTHQTQLGCRGYFDGSVFKHTNINLTTEMGSDWLICHVLKKYVSPTMITSYNTYLILTMIVLYVTSINLHGDEQN